MSKQLQTPYSSARSKAISAPLFLAIWLGVLPLAPCWMATASAQTIQQIQTVFVIALENHNLIQPTPTSTPEQLLGNPAAPFLNSLITPGNSNAAQVSFAAQYFNVATGVHPSEPNYIWAEAGTDFGVETDADPSAASGNSFSAPHLTSQLNTAGIAWKNYQEDLEFASAPTVSASGRSSSAVNRFYGTGDYYYAVKHNPMAFFTDTQNQNVYPLSHLFSDLTNNTVGRYNWITPNMYNNMHSPLGGGFTYHGVGYAGDQASIAQGDNFLATIIPIIMASQAYQSNGLIIIRWDETEGGDRTNYVIPEIIISPLAKGNAYASAVPMCHSSDVKTMEEIFGLSLLTNAIPPNEVSALGSGYNNVATVNDLSDLFQTKPAQTPPPSPTPVTNAPPAVTGPITHFAGHMMPDGTGFQLSFAGTAGRNYRILASDDPTLPVASWTALTNGSLTGSNMLFHDFDAVNHPHRFYVIKLP